MSESTVDQTTTTTSVEKTAETITPSVTITQSNNQNGNEQQQQPVTITSNIVTSNNNNPPSPSPVRSAAALQVNPNNSPNTSTQNLSSSTTAPSSISLVSSTKSDNNNNNNQPNNYHAEEFQFALENKKTLKRLLKISKHWTDSMKVYCQNSHLFSEELLKQSDQMIAFNQQKEKNLGSNLSYFGNTIKAVNSVHDQMLNEIQDVFCTPVANFVDYDFAEVVESNKRVQKSKEDYDISLGKISASIKKSKAVDETRLFNYEQELEKLKDVLEGHNKDLEIKLDELAHKNETKYLRSLLHFVNAQYLYFNRASKLFANLKPRIEEIENYLEEIQPPKVVEGHLMKKSKQVMGGWNKCWYVLKDGMLYCYKGKKEFHPENALNILLCSVRVPQILLSSPTTNSGLSSNTSTMTSTSGGSIGGGTTSSSSSSTSNIVSSSSTLNLNSSSSTVSVNQKEIDYRFEILHPRKKQPIVLQAENEEERDRWVSAIQEAISNSLNSQSLEKSTSMSGTLGKPLSSSSVSSTQIQSDEANQQVVRILQRVPGNNVCADCSSPDPDWASINLGIIICKVCSGVHRSLGTHISKVRSLTLDKWSADNVSLMKEIGNQRFNQLYEHHLHELSTGKPTDKSDRMAKETYIRAKYKNRDFIIKSSLPSDELSKMTIELAATGCRDVMRYIRLMGQGADTNSADADGRNSLIHAIWRADDIIIPELLLQNGADITATDSRGWTPMHYAAFFNRPRCAHLLMRRGFEAIRLKCRDHLGRLPLDLATLNRAKETEQVLRGEELSLGLTMDNIENNNVQPFEATIPASTDFPKEEILSEEEDDDKYPDEVETNSWSESERDSVGRASFSDPNPTSLNTDGSLAQSFNSSNSIGDSASSKESSKENLKDAASLAKEKEKESNLAKVNRPKSNRRPSLLGRGRNTLRMVKNKLNMSKQGGMSTIDEGGVEHQPSGLATSSLAADQSSDDGDEEDEMTDSQDPKQLYHRESLDSVYSTTSTTSAKHRTMPTSQTHSLPPSHSTSLNDLHDGNNTAAGEQSLSPNKHTSPTPFKIFLKKFKGSIGGKKKDKSATTPGESHLKNNNDQSTESSQTDEGAFDDDDNSSQASTTTSPLSKKDKKTKKKKEKESESISGAANNSPALAPIQISPPIDHSSNSSN